MSERRYFRLDSRRFLTVGAQRGVVHDLETGAAMWLDAPNTAALQRSETNEPIEIEPELFGRLEERGWGFFTSQPPFVDKLRRYNVFREKRLWKETPFLSTAVLQLTNDCVRTCAACASAFCPICRLSEDGREPLTTAAWLSVIDEVALFGGQQLILTGGEALLHPDLSRIAAAGRARGLRVQIHTSGLLAPPADLPPVTFSILIRGVGEIAGVVERFGERDGVTLLVDEIEPAALAGRVPPRWIVLRTSSRPPSITKDKLLLTGFERFFARALTDDCLNGKIYIGHDGAVFPCFGHRAAPLGYVRDADGFASAIRILVDDYWNVPVDRVDAERPCARCEFRYCCSSCRYFDPVDRCGYDPDASVWK